MVIIKIGDTMKIDKKINKIFEQINKMNGNSPDITTRQIKIGFKSIGYIYLESVSSDDKISDFLVKSITRLKRTHFLDNFFTNLYKELENNIANSKMKTIDNYEDMFYYLSSGFTVVIVDGFNKSIVLETKEKLDRGVTEPTTEVSIRGPKDSFTENYNKNLGLVRKRVKDPNLWFKEFLVGRRSKTKVSVGYIKDIADINKVERVFQKIDSIDIDAILDSGYIRDFLAKDDRTTFPTIISTERPDLVSASLLEGKIVVIVENTPFALVMPGTITNFIHSPEDNYQKAINVSLTRALRLIAMLITITAPALYVAATTFNQEVIPDTLLISLAIQRSRVPFPTSFAIIILMLTFEILRESDMRLPETMGTSISIVGALVLGDAAVNAGIVSPIVVIVVAISSITGLLFTDMDIVNAFRYWRLFFLLVASTMGLIGFVIASIIFIIKLCSIESLELPYLTPFSPLYINSFQDSIFTLPRNKMKKRPPYLASKNIHRVGDKNEN